MICPLYRLLGIPLFLLISIYSTPGISAERGEKPATPPPTTAAVLKSQGSLYWLQFDADAHSLWPVLKKFWSTQGIELASEQPALGYMQTRWINDTRLSKKASAIFFSDSAPELRERFRLRIEPLADNTGSRVFIHHTSYGILLDEEAVYTGYLPPSPQLEIEMLARLALFSGADKNTTHEIIANYKPTQLVASAGENNRYEIHMPGTEEFVHKKLIQALDRMDIETKTTAEGTIIATRTSTSNIENPDIAKEKGEWEIDDSSDLEESGFSFWASSVSNKDDAPVNNVYRLHLTEKESYTLIQIGNDNKNSPDELKAFSAAVARDLNR